MAPVQELIGVNFNTPIISKKKDWAETEEKDLVFEAHYQEEEESSVELA